MRLRILIILFCMLLSLRTAAQELRTVSLEASPTRIMNGSLQRADLNGVTAALLIVRLPSEGVKFDGDLIGEPLFDVNEYYVWLEAGCRMVQVKCPGVNSLMVHFEDLGIPALKSGQVYELTLETATRPADNGNRQISGFTKSSEGGAAIAGVVINVVGAPEHAAKSDAGGHYWLKEIYPGMTLLFSADGYRKVKMSFSGGVPEKVNVYMEKSNGRQLAQEIVQVNPAVKEYTVGSIVSQPPRSESTVVASNVEAKGSMLHGTVYLGREPCIGATVCVKDSNSQEQIAVTDIDGNFSLTGVRPGMTVEARWLKKRKSVKIGKKIPERLKISFGRF